MSQDTTFAKFEALLKPQSFSQDGCSVDASYDTMKQVLFHFLFMLYDIDSPYNSKSKDYLGNVEDTIQIIRAIPYGHANGLWCICRSIFQNVKAAPTILQRIEIQYNRTSETTTAVIQSLSERKRTLPEEIKNYSQALLTSKWDRACLGTVRWVQHELFDPDTASFVKVSNIGPHHEKLYFDGELAQKKAGPKEQQIASNIQSFRSDHEEADFEDGFVFLSKPGEVTTRSTGNNNLKAASQEKTYKSNDSISEKCPTSQAIIGREILGAKRNLFDQSLDRKHIPNSLAQPLTQMFPLDTASTSFASSQSKTRLVSDTELGSEQRNPARPRFITNPFETSSQEPFPLFRPETPNSKIETSDFSYSPALQSLRRLPGMPPDGCQVSQAEKEWEAWMTSLRKSRTG